MPAHALTNLNDTEFKLLHLFSIDKFACSRNAPQLSTCVLHPAAPAPRNFRHSYSFPLMRG